MATDRSARFNHNSNPRAIFSPRVHFDPHALLILLTLVVLPGLGWTFFRTLKPVTISIDRQAIAVMTNQSTVAGVLSDHAIALYPQDLVSPALDAPITANQTIQLRRAQPLEISADGEILRHRTQAKTIADALREAGILLKPSDRVLNGDAALHPNDALNRPPTPNPQSDLPSLQLLVQRALPIQIDDNGAPTTIFTTASTLGEALRDAGYVIFLGDSVTPDLGTPIAPGWQVFIRRSKPVTISVDGRTFLTRTRGETIAELFRDEGIVLRDKDYSDPKPEQSIRDNLAITIMRVREELITESEAIPYETVWQADGLMEIDEHLITQSGVEGTKKRNIQMRFENGREVRRTIDREWIDTAPTTQIINYGTKIVKRDLTLPNGQTISYWRKIRMLATSYTAATSGKARSNPAFGITATGLPAGVGVVAVDPRVVNLRSRVYVPGYGVAIAGDTGGGIKGKRIDLGYDEWNLVLWAQWVDIYLLDPPPAADQIHFVLPDTPRERVTLSR